MSELIVEDILRPLVRFLRADPVLMELRTTVMEGSLNPILGPPTMVSREDQGFVPYEGSDAPWIFRNFSNSGQPFAHVEGTGSSSITLEYNTDWTRHVRGRSHSFPTIEVYYHCDPTRDAVGVPIRFDAKDKCLTLHKRIDRLFNIRDKGVGGFLEWGAKEDGTGALKVISSAPGDPLRTVPDYDGDGLIEGKATFEMEVLF